VTKLAGKADVKITSVSVPQQEEAYEERLRNIEQGTTRLVWSEWWQ
jgi:hypothetical protein